MGFPVGAEQRKGIYGQGDVPIFGALPTMDMDLEARAINVGDLEGEGFMEPEASTIDSGEVDLVVQGGGGREEPANLLHTKDGRETVVGGRAHERKGVPVALEDVLIEEADATVADTQGSWGKAIHVFPVQEIALEFLFGEHVG